MPNTGPEPLVAQSTPMTVDAAPRHVAAAIDNFFQSQGVAPSWNTTRTEATVSETTPAATVSLTFSLRSAGSGKTNLVAEVTFESDLLAVAPRDMIKAQLEQSCNQLAQVVAHLATRDLGAPDQGLGGAA